MRSAGTAYCCKCRAYGESFVDVGWPPFGVVLVCERCGWVLLTARPEFDIAGDDLPAFARMHMIPKVPHDDESEAFRLASFGERAK